MHVAPQNIKNTFLIGFFFFFFFEIKQIEGFLTIGAILKAIIKTSGPLPLRCPKSTTATTHQTHDPKSTTTTTPQQTMTQNHLAPPHIFLREFEPEDACKSNDDKFQQKGRCEI